MKMRRKCSNCRNIGHNSRTCTSYKGNLNSAATSTSTSSSGISIGLRLFGVPLVDISSSSSCSSASKSQATDIKSFSMDCLMSLPNSHSSSSSLISVNEISDRNYIGYLPDDLIARVQDRKKGVPWTKEEHRSFLAGLEKLGKGDWRGISRNFVPTRTPTQVASHAQKYFLRQVTLDKKKCRSSLFDMGSSSSIVTAENNLHQLNLNLSEQDRTGNRNQEIGDECNANLTIPFGHMDQKTFR